MRNKAITVTAPDLHKMSYRTCLGLTNSQGGDGTSSAGDGESAIVPPRAPTCGDTLLAATAACCFLVILLVLVLEALW